MNSLRQTGSGMFRPIRAEADRGVPKSDFLSMVQDIVRIVTFMAKNRNRLAVRILTRILIAASGLATVCWAELPVDPLLEEPLSNQPPRGIVVPGPERPGTTGTNDAAQPEALPAPPRRQFNNAMNHWKLVPPPRPTQDSLLLRNADVVQGRFVGLDATVLGWEMPEAAGLIRFRRDGLNNLRLRAGQEAAGQPGRWVVRLSTGNLLQGQSLVVDQRQVILESSLAGQLSFPREMVSQVYHDPDAAKSAFRPLQNLEDWSQIQAQGELMTQQYFRELDLPESFLVEFDLPSQQQGFVRVHLPLSSPQLMYVEPHVSVNLQANNVMIQSFGENMALGGHSVQFKGNSTGRWRVAIACNRSLGRVVVYVDGKQVHAVELGAVFNPKAKGLLITSGGPVAALPNRSVLLSRLGEELVLPSAKPEQDLLRLANGDAMVGQLVSLDATKVVFLGPLGRLELPVERVAGAGFASAKVALPRRRDADVTVQLVDGGNLTAELKELGPESLSLSSDMFGQIKIARSAVRGLQFGLYLPAPKDVPFTYDIYQRQLRENEPGKIRLNNGLVLSGTLTGLANGLVGWQHPHATAPIGFAQTNVTFASPVPSTSTTNLPPLASTVQLTNGDSYRGELASLDGQQLLVRTMYTGALSIPRRYVSALFPNLAADGVLDAGPIERWLVPGPAGQNQEGQAQYVRNDKLPDRVCLQLELVGQPGPWYVSAWLFGRSDGQNVNAIRSGYGIQLHGGATITLYEVSQDGQYQQSTQVNVPNLTRSGQVRLTWLADRVKKEAFLLVDGKLVAERRNIKPAIAGNMVHLTVQNQNLCRVRTVALQEWKGRAEDLLAAPPAGDLVRLHDWTVLGGPVEALREGQAFLSRGQSVPLGRVASIHLDTANQARARRTKADVRLTLVNGDILTLNSPLIDQRGLVGTAEGLGTVILDPAAIRRLHFQPYEPPRRTDPTFPGGG